MLNIWTRKKSQAGSTALVSRAGRNILRSGAAATAAIALALAIIAVPAFDSVTTPRALGAPGNPGVPGDPVEVYKETFGTSANPAISLRNYPSSSSPRYKASDDWLPPTSFDSAAMTGKCNGWILSSATPLVDTSLDYGCNPSGGTKMWPQLQALASVIGQYQGDSNPSANNVLSSASNANNLVQQAGTLIESINPVVTAARGGRFYSVGAVFAALNCYKTNPSHSPTFVDPNEYFYLKVNGVESLLGSGLNPCTNGTRYSTSAGDAYVHRLVAPARLLGDINNPSATFTLGFRLYNATATGAGNDVAFDSPSVLDVTPQLDQQFVAPVVPVGGNSNWVFTITNTKDLEAKQGWAFTTPVPAGLTVTGAATSTCAGASVSVSGGNVVVTGGNLAKGATSCTITVPVSPPADGTYTAPASAFSVIWALNEPADASLSTSQLALAASVDPTAATAAGQNATFKFEVTNSGSAAVQDLKIAVSSFTGSGTLGTITCPSTTLASGATTTCTAAYTTTQADIDAGSVSVTAKANAQATGATDRTESNSDSATLTVLGNRSIGITAVNPGSMSNAGDVKTFTFNVTNTGQATLNTVSVRIEDFSGSGTPPTFTCAATTLAAGASTTCTGTYTVTAADITARVVNLDVVAVGKDVLGGNVTSTEVSVQVPYLSGDPDKDKSYLEVNKSTEVVGNPVVATATILDRNDFPLQGVTVTFGLTGQGTFGAADATRVPTATCVTLATGKCSVTLTDPRAETTNVSATVPIGATATPIKNSPLPVVFTAGTADASKSTFVLDRTSQEVGKNISATSTIVDRFGNPISNQVVDLTVDGRATFGAVRSPRVGTTTCTTNTSGVCTVTFTDPRVQTVSVTSMINGTHLGGNGNAAQSSPQNASFTAGPPNPKPPPCVDTSMSGSSLTVDRDYVVVGTTVYFTGLVTDEFCNPIGNVPVTFTIVNATSGQLTVTQGVTDAQGKAFANLVDTKPEIVNVNAAIAEGDLDGSPLPVEYYAGPFSWTKSTFEVTPVATVGTTSTYVEVSTGDKYYTGKLTPRDEYDNILKNLNASDVKFLTSTTNVKMDNFKANTDGTFTIEYSSKIASATPTASVTYQNTQVGTNKPIPFKAGAPDPDPDCDEPGRPGTSLTANPVRVLVSGSSTITAFVTDSFCNPTPGAIVDFTLVPGSSATLSAAQAEVNDQGFATITVTDATVETVRVHGDLVTGRIHNSPAQVEFYAGDLDPTKSTFAVHITSGASQVVANGVDSWTGTLTARDSSNNLLTNLDVSAITFAATPAGWSVTGVTNNNDGTYTVKYTSTKATTYQASVKYGTTQVGTNLPITFVAGPVHDKYSTLTVNPPEQVAGSPVTVTVTARDEFDNPVTGLVASDFVVKGVSSGLPDMTMWSFVESAPGVYTWQATSYLVGVFDLSAVVTGVKLSEEPTVTFTAGEVCVNNCQPVNPDNVTRFEMRDNDRLANGVAQDSAKAFAYDHYGNAVKNALVRVVDESTGVQAGYLTPNIYEIRTGNDGTAMIYWTSTKADTFTARGSINGLYPPATNVMNEIRFTAGTASAEKSDLVVTPASPQIAGESYTATVTVRDATGNLLRDETVNFWLTPASPATLSAATCKTDITGTCSVTVRSELVTTVAIHASVSEGGTQAEVRGNGNPAKASPQSVAWIAGPVCVQNCTPVDPDNITRVEVVVDGVQANGAASDVAKVWAFDRFGNEVRDATVVSTTSDSDLTIVSPIPKTDTHGNALIEYRSTDAGAHVAMVLVDGKVPTQAFSSVGLRLNGAITLNFGSGTVDPSHSFLTIDPQVAQVVGSTFKVTAHLFDTNDNAVEGTVVTFPAIANLTFSATTCTSLADGTCDVTVSSKIVGSYTISGEVSGVPLRNTVKAEFFHGPVCVVNCEPVVDSNRTRVEVIVDGHVADGVDHDVAKVWAYDIYGNAVDDAVVTSAPTAAEQNLAVQPDIAKTGTDGTTTIWYTSTVRGAHYANVLVDSKVPTGSPITLNFGSGDGDAGQSSWVITPASPLVVGVDAANTYTVRATVKDKTGNPVSGAVVTFNIDPTAPVWAPAPNCTTNNAGICSTAVYSTKSGTYNVTASIVAGPIKNADTGQPSAAVVWIADEVCSQLEGCDPVDPNLDQSLRTRVVILVNNQPADGNSQDRVRVYAFDKWGNAVEGALVQSTGGANLKIQSGIAPIGKDGTTTIYYTSTVAGSYPAGVTANGKRPVGSPVTLIFTDNVAPNPPVITSPSDGDVVTTKTPEIKGTGDEPANKITVKDEGGNTICTATVQADKTWSCTPTSPLGEGNHTIVAKETDPSNNESAPSNEVTFTVDTVAPNPPVITSPTDGESTKNDKPVITGTGDAEGDTITVKDEGGNTVCTATVQADKTWSCTPTSSFTEGDHTIVAKEKDPAGNESGPSNEVTFTVDKTAPNPPVITSPKNGDSTKNDKPVITGTGDAKDDTITVKDEGGNTVCTATVLADKTWSCTPTNSFTEGPHTIVATEKDRAQNESGPSNTVTFTVDKTAPRPPYITDPADKSVTKDNTPEIKGTGDEPGNTITVKDANKKELCTAIVQSDKKWSCSPSTPMPDGDYRITAWEIDKAGNVSDESNTVTFTIDSVRPSNPTVEDSNGSELRGTSDGDTTVTVRDEDGNPIPGCIDIPATGGKWICHPTTKLDEGDKITVQAKDPAGNESDRVPSVIRGLRILITYPVRNPLQTQVVTGNYFNPGENVCLFLHSTTPMPFGCKDADDQGTVTFSFTVPDKYADGTTFENGIHKVELRGAISGSVDGTFEVARKPIVQTGGTSVSNALLLEGLATGLIVVAAGVWLSGRRRVTSR